MLMIRLQATERAQGHPHGRGQSKQGYTRNQGAETGRQMPPMGRFWGAQMRGAARLQVLGRQGVATQVDRAPPSVLLSLSRFFRHENRGISYFDLPPRRPWVPSLRFVTSSPSTTREKCELAHTSPQ